MFENIHKSHGHKLYVKQGVSFFCQQEHQRKCLCWHRIKYNVQKESLIKCMLLIMRGILSDSDAILLQLIHEGSINGIVDLDSINQNVGHGTALIKMWTTVRRRISLVLYNACQLAHNQWKGSKLPVDHGAAEKFNPPPCVLRGNTSRTV